MGGTCHVEVTAQNSLNKGLFRQICVEDGWLWQKFCKKIIIKNGQFSVKVHHESGYGGKSW